MQAAETEKDRILKNGWWTYIVVCFMESQKNNPRHKLQTQKAETNLKQ